MFSVEAEAAALRLPDQPLGVLRMKSVQNGEEVLPGACFRLRVSIREVLRHAWQLKTRAVEILDRDLIVARGVAELDILGLEQKFVLFQDLLQPGRGHHVIRWHKVLAI